MRGLTSRYLLALPALLLCVSPADAQPQEEYRLSSQLGIGGGPYYMMQQLSLRDLDVRLESMGLEALPEWMEMWGAGGSIHVGPVLVGGYSWSGTLTRSTQTGGILRETRVDMARGGFTAGYVKVAGTMKLTFGLTVGGGTLDVTARRAPAGAPAWDDLWEYYESGFTGTVDAADLAVSTRFSGRWLALEPSVSIRIRVWKMINADLAALYHYGRIGAGKLKANGIAVPDAPVLDVSGLGFRVGLFLGF